MERLTMSRVKDPTSMVKMEC